MSLKVQNVSYYYEQDTELRRPALQEVNLEINSGEFIGLIGHTGSGKSTLVQHLNGLLKPTTGTVTFNDEDIHAKGYNKKDLRYKVGLVFQYPEHQLFEIDVFTDVCFGPKNMGLSKEEIEKRANEALEMVGFPKELYTQSPFDLSGGQKRRVAIAGVLAMKPEILVLDEPTAGLDPKGRDDILQMLKKLKQDTGIAIVLVSHSMEDVASFVERIIAMDHGRVVFDDVPARVFSNREKLEQMGLSVPQVTTILQELQKAGIAVKGSAITVGQAKEEILEALKKSI